MITHEEIMELRKRNPWAPELSLNQSGEDRRAGYLRACDILEDIMDEEGKK